tara:strand:+ start:25681 stop:27228 length:1548 start_codon:yes stop_codon:yes gene_type:complete
MEKNTINSNVQFVDEDEIDLLKLFKILFKKKNFILISTIISIIIGYLSFKTRQPVWQGQFDIVLKNNSSKNSNLNPLEAINSQIISQFTGKGSLDLKTEVEILKSQSILIPIYDFVINEKFKDNRDFSPPTFEVWKKSLNIKLSRGTSVLNIKYIDSNKSLIKPVLNNIAIAYREYSNKDRNQGLRKGINYLEKQKEKMTLASKESFIKLQDYELKNNLGNLDGIIPLNNSTGIIPNQSLNSQSINHGALFKPSSRFGGNFNQLYQLESLLVRKSALLKPNSSQIINLKNQIEQLKNSLARPSKIILEHRSLTRNALRDEELLINIEAQLEKLKIDLARQEEPWELISNPTLLNKPISPNRNKSIFFGGIIGGLISSVLVLIYYKYEDKIDNREYFEKLIPYKFIKTLLLNEYPTWQNYIKFLIDFYAKSTPNDNFGFLLISDKNSEKFKSMNQVLNEKYTADKLVISNLLADLENCEQIFLVVEPNVISVKRFNYLLEDLIIFNKNILGWIYID